MRALRVSHSAVVDGWRERERALRRLGHDVRLLSARSWSEGGRVVPLEPRPGEPVTGVATLGRHPALFVYDPRPLWRELGRPLDVVDVHEEPFALATAEVLLLRLLRRQRAPYVLYSAQNLDKRYPPPFRWLERWALRHASGVSVCSDAAGAVVERKGFPGRARTIDLGTDLDTFTRAHAPDGRTTDAVVVGFAGRLEQAKGAHVLLEALALAPALHARLAGDGPQRPALDALATALGVAGRVEHLGALDPTALPAFYRSVDVVVVPSLTTDSWVEQFGRVALEAMACGTPVVVSDSGALPATVAGAALVVPEGDGAALAGAVLDVATQPAVRRRLRAAGTARAAASSWEAVGERYDELYRVATRTPRDDGPGWRPLEVVVVAYGQPRLLARALAPLDGKSVTVVDNSSSPAVRAVAEAAAVRYVDPGRNGGFAAGVDEALRRIERRAPDADVLLVNPDAVVAPPDVDALVAALAADPGLASVGPAQVDDAGHAARVTWPFPSPLGTWLEAVGLGRWRRDRYVIGSVLLLRREALDQVGPFDEDRFFLYGEETDWAARAVRLGWRHALVPEASAVHVGAATSTDAARRDAHAHAAQELFLRKHHGALGWQVSRAGQVVGAALRAVVLPGERRASARRRLRANLVGPARAEQRPADHGVTTAGEA